MPIPLPSQVKADFIALTEAAPSPYAGPAIADRYQTVLNNYEDVEMAIKWQLELFAGNNAYLTQAMNLFDPNLLATVGILYNNHQTSPAVTDPKMIINSDYTEVILTPSSPAAYKTLTILGIGSIGSIVLAPGTVLNELYIGPGTPVDLLNGALINSSPLATSYVGLIWLPYLRSTPSALNAVSYQTVMGQVILDEGSYFGGVLGEDPENICATPVQKMYFEEVTKNSVVLKWIPPTSGSPAVAEYLFINTFFRKLNNKTWILATEEDGDFIGDIGFAFRNLESNTYYEFKADVVCRNGGIVSTMVSTSTK